PKSFYAERDHLAAGRRRCFQLQFANRSEMPPILIAPRTVQQEIFDAEDPESLQLPRPFRTDAPQRGHRPGERRSGWSWNCDSHSFARYKSRNAASTGKLYFNHRDLRPAIESHRHGKPADARIDVE